MLSSSLPYSELAASESSCLRTLPDAPLSAERERGGGEGGKEREGGKREVIDTLSCVVFLLTSDIQ